MSRVFSNTTDKQGLVQMFEEEIGKDYGFVSGNTDRLKSFTSATRSTWDRYLHIAFDASGKWEYDDTNHQDASGNYTYPIIKTNLVSGQRDYTFTDDENGNLLLDIHKVAILPSATDTEFDELYPVDEKEDWDILGETTSTGTPTRYGKLANGIFLNIPTDYNATNGLKLYINREPSYFTSSDTTKKPGCPGIHHDYFYLRPAMEYARRNSLDSYERLKEAVIEFEGDEKRGITGSIARYFARRARDEEKFISTEKISYR